MIIWCLFLITYLSYCTAYNILGVFPLRHKSHFIIYDALMTELAARGHDVTVINSYPKKIPINRYTDIDVRSCMEDTTMNITGGPGAVTTFVMMNYRMNFPFTPNIITNCDPIKDLFNWTKNDHPFDLLIVESFASDLLFGLTYNLKVPLIGITPNVLDPWQSDWLACGSNPSYVPTMYDGLLPKMKFQEKLINVMTYCMAYFVSYVNTKAMDHGLVQMYGEGVPPLDDIVRNMSIMFTYSHWSFNPVRLLPPNVIEIGGLNIKEPMPLPQDIEKFINEAEHGVVYFSMGSILKGSSFPSDKRDALLQAFSKIPQRVLWKWEDENLPGKPQNVMISKWMPQRDILAHPNVKLFISHGGLLGTSEAVYEGVPILGIPIFGDQSSNIKAIQASGAAELLKYQDLTEETILEKIQLILNNPSYKENAKELSRRYRDRPMSPLDTAVYWTEYVIRHKGAPHLKSAAVQMPWYQYLLFDVVAFILAILIITISFIYYSLKTFVRLSFKLVNYSKIKNS